MHLSEAKKRPQLSANELYQVNWFLGIAMAMLSVLTAFYLPHPIQPHLLATVGLVSLAFLRPQLAAAVPKLFWQAMPFFLVILLAIDLHLSHDPIPALIRLNILLILYRCLAFRRKREDLQLIVLCLFLVIIVGVLTLALSFVLQILVFTGLAMAFLFNITLMDARRETIHVRDVWRDFTWRRFGRKIWALCDTSSMMVAGITFASVVFFTVALFFLIPRVDINNPLPFLGLSRTSQTGFSESIRFGDVTDIRNNDRVALRVEVSSPEKVPTDPYWRMLVLDQYENGGFQVSRAVVHNHRSDSKVTQIRFNDYLIGASHPPEVTNTWTFYLEGGVARYLPLTGRFRRLRFQEPRNVTYLTPFHVFGSSRVNSSMLVYQVDDMEFHGRFEDPDFGKYTLDYPYYPEMDFFFDHDYVNYPDTTLALNVARPDREYLLGLVEEIRAGDTLTHAELAGRISSWLQARHTYSMTFNLAPGIEDYVVRWLKARSPGHCEAFAGAMILLCRTAGIPARAVTGFKGGTWNTFENYFMVRYSDAHAWVEIFDGEGAWLRFDPTPGSIESGASPLAAMAQATSATDSSFSAYLDSLRIIWYRRVVSFDQKSQFELFANLRTTWERLDPRRWATEMRDFFLAWMSAPWDGKRVAEVIGLIGSGGLFCFLVAFCVRKDRMSLFTLGRRGGDPVRRRAGTYLIRLRELTAPKAGNRALIDPAPFERMQEQLQRLRYGPAEARAGADVVFREVRRYLRRRR